MIRPDRRSRMLGSTCPVRRTAPQKLVSIWARPHRGSLDGAEQTVARIVDEDVDAAGLPQRPGDRGARTVVAAHVELQHLDALGARSVQRLPARAERAIAARREQRCGCKADPRGCPGNESDEPVGQSLLLVCVCSFSGVKRSLSRPVSSWLSRGRSAPLPNPPAPARFRAISEGRRRNAMSHAGVRLPPAIWRFSLGSPSPRRQCRRRPV